MADQVFDEALAQHVCQLGMVTAAQVTEAQQAQADAAQRGILLSLADALVQLDFITRTQREKMEQEVRARMEGAQMLGQYKLLRKLGEGAMGAVYLADDTIGQRKVALKILPAKYFSDPEYLTRFRREARAAGRLNHANIVAAYTAGEEAGQHFLVMEYCEGESLEKTLKREGFLPWDKALEITIQATRGLQHAHEHGLIHRDVKPGNIFVTTNGEAKILDLGLSKVIGAGEQSFNTQTGVALGTPHYISPEQARGEKTVDGRTDIYSLGATLYHVVTGETPFQGSTAAMIMLKHLNDQIPNPQDIREDIPDNVALVIQKMMAKDPADRHRDCKELLGDLELVLHGAMPSSQAIEVGKSSVAVRVRPPRRPARMGTARHEAVGTRRHEPVAAVREARGAHPQQRVSTQEHAPVAKVALPPRRAAPKAISPNIVYAALAGAALLLLLPFLLSGGPEDDGAAPRDNGKTGAASAGDPRPDTSSRPGGAFGQTPPATAAVVDPDAARERYAQRLLDGLSAREKAGAGTAENLRRGLQVIVDRYSATRAGKAAAERLKGLAETAAPKPETPVDDPARSTVAAGADATDQKAGISADVPAQSHRAAALEVTGKGVSTRANGPAVVEPEKKGATDTQVAAPTPQPASVPGPPTDLAADMARESSAAAALKKAEALLKDRKWGEARKYVQDLKKDYLGAVALTRWLESHRDELARAPGLRAKYYEYFGGVNAADMTDKLPNPLGTRTVEHLCIPNEDALREVFGREDHIAVRFHGFLEIPRDGDYTFYLDSDDGSVAYIGNSLVVNFDGGHAMAALSKPPVPEKKGTATFKAGACPLRVNYWQGGGGAGLVLSWSGPGLPKQAILPGAFSHTVEPDETDSKAAPATAAAVSGEAAKPLALDLTAVMRMNFVYVPAGEFVMGSEEGEADEKPAHQVRITQPFYIGKFEVTVGQFKCFVDATGHRTDAEKAGNKGGGIKERKWQERAGINWKMPGFLQNATCPVMLVSWSDARAFAAWAAKVTGKTVRLPTEAEWEYAARGPQNPRFPWGDEWDGRRANHADVTLKKSSIVDPRGVFSTDTDGYAYTAPVCTYPNASWCGAFDMTGNLLEWVQDRYDPDYYRTSPASDPQGPDSGGDRVYRGGCWLDPPSFCRATRRRHEPPGARNMAVGFRLVVTIPPKTP